ncbi:MAG: tRNA lysidine(34) synthetase TilS [Alphaproteobacteria bacterium]|nr:tRNA lysidine(34) synthetase TilS [Alphaproteobacteria bacterium]
MRDPDDRAGLRSVERLDRVVVVSIDHGLRPEAAEEALFVAKEASRLGFAHQTLRADETAPTSGVQEWARGLRQRLLMELLDAERWQLHERNIDWFSYWNRLLVMAHHLDDQAETLVMRLARGSGVDGLAGVRREQTLSIPPHDQRRYGISARVVRPFLGVPKARLLATLRLRKCDYRDDPSNADQRFERVRMRQILPLLHKAGISSPAIALSARRIADAQETLSRLCDQWEMGKVDWGIGLFASVKLPLLAADGYRYAGVRLMRRVLRAHGGAAREATLAQVEGLYQRVILKGGRSMAETVGLTLGGCKVEFLEAGGEPVMRVFREMGREGLPRLEVAPGESVFWDGSRFRISCEGKAPGRVVAAAVGEDGWAGLKRDIAGLEDHTGALPAAAMATLPAIWQEGRIVSVPFFDTFFQDNAAMIEAIGTGIGQEIERPLYHAAFTGLSEAAERT